MFFSFGERPPSSDHANEYIVMLPALWLSLFNSLSMNTLLFVKNPPRVGLQIFPWGSVRGKNPPPHPAGGIQAAGVETLLETKGLRLLKLFNRPGRMHGKGNQNEFYYTWK